MKEKAPPMMGGFLSERNDSKSVFFRAEQSGAQRANDEGETEEGRWYFYADIRGRDVGSMGDYGGFVIRGAFRLATMHALTSRVAWSTGGKTNSGMELNKTQLLNRYTANGPDKWKSTGFIKLPTRLLFDERLERADVAIYAVLRARTFHGKEITFPSLKTIAKEARYTKPSVIKALKNLETHGYIKIERQPKDSRKTNRYTLLECG